MSDDGVETAFHVALARVAPRAQRARARARTRRHGEACARWERDADARARWTVVAVRER